MLIKRDGPRCAEGDHSGALSRIRAVGLPVMSELTSFVGRMVNIITNDGKCVLGSFSGFDQYTNIVLVNTTERVFSRECGVEEVPLGLYVMRGDNIAVIGEVDEVLDSETQWTDVRADPLKPLTH